ncbi:MAG: glycosyltransferase family 4 protein [Salinivirgaceae bacterium]|nr:glycosyltransferase family 4 protein [Salinivirgaceae bacterium]
MIKIALFADTTLTRSGITGYCYSLKNMLESRGDFVVSVFADLPHKRCRFFHIYDEKAIKKSLLSADFDIIHINGFISTIPFYVCRGLKSLGINKPIVYTPHAHPFYTVNRPLLARAFFHIFVKPILKKANAVISINKEDYVFFTKYNKNVYTIQHWFDKKYEAVAEKDKSKKSVILFVGRNDDNKNLKVLYSLPKDKFEIVCVTNIKPEREDFIFKTQISEDELSELYLKASLTVIPSRYEGFSYVALESLLRGTPVLMSNRVRIADFLENISGVTIYDYARPDDFVNKIEEAINNNSSVDINRIKDVFSVDKAFSMYSNVYKNTYYSYFNEIN